MKKSNNSVLILTVLGIVLWKTGQLDNVIDPDTSPQPDTNNVIPEPSASLKQMVTPLIGSVPDKQARGELVGFWKDMAYILPDLDLTTTEDFQDLVTKSHGVILTSSDLDYGTYGTASSQILNNYRDNKAIDDTVEKQLIDLSNAIAWALSQ